MKTERLTQSGIRVRPLRPEESDTADRILDSVYSNYAGPIDRGVLSRPGEMGMRFLAEENGRPVGTATFAASGAVLDWAVVPGRDPDPVGSELLRAGEDWVRDQGGAEILLYSPPSSAPTEHLLRDLGFRAVTPPHVVLQIVHFPNLLGALVAARSDRFRALAPFTLAIHLEPGLYPPVETPDLLVRATAEGPSVEVGVDQADASLSITATRFTEFLVGATDLDGFLETSVSLTPASARETARHVLEALAFGRPWFSPLGERR